MDAAKAGEAHPELALDEHVFHAVELYFIDSLVKNAFGDAESFGGEFKNLGADGEIFPDHVGDWENQCDEDEWCSWARKH